MVMGLGGGEGMVEGGQVAGGGGVWAECWECWITSHVDAGAGAVCGGFGGGDEGVAVTLARLDGAGGSRQLHGTMMFACLQSRFFFSQFLHIGLLSSHLMRRARQVALRERVRHPWPVGHVMLAHHPGEALACCRSTLRLWWHLFCGVCLLFSSCARDGKLHSERCPKVCTCRGLCGHLRGSLTSSGILLQ